MLTVGVDNGAPSGGSGTQYFIGDFDGKRFTSENPKEWILWADHGADYYAAQSWNDEPNQRRLMLGWMNNWQYARHAPTSSWRGSFSLVRELALTWTDEGVRLLQKPVPELQALRGEHLHWQQEVIHPGVNLLADVRGSLLEIIAEFEIDEAVDCFGLRVRVGKDEHTTICYAVKEKRLSVDRTRSGQVDFEGGFASVHSADLSPMNNVLSLHIFVDRSSVEVFANDGLVTFSECIFPSEQSDKLELFVEGGTVLLTSLDLFHLNPATFRTIKN